MEVSEEKVEAAGRASLESSDAIAGETGSDSGEKEAQSQSIIDEVDEDHPDAESTNYLRYDKQPW